MCACFSLPRSMNSQKMPCYGSENPHLYFEQSLYNLKIRVRCTMSGFRIKIRLFHQTVNAYRYVQNQFNPFVDQLTKMNDCMDIFRTRQSNSITALTISSRVHEVFSEKRSISRGSKTSCSLRSSDLSPGDFYQ
ncbi:hypothetical protein NPIL_432721 [Nephila pilipes]|uniref:Uncharacterized protein n=1 Tax=Nephila pilipes TaxID=299642 RepID=A0A8X6NEF5_NEPPI|nr:hypothetical protein NPIL_432721 [Nephila pilipes]